MKLDANMALTQAVKLPPITPVDPFSNDDNGRAFKLYPGHKKFSNGTDNIPHA